ncbi:MAG: hypothetical protein ACMG55_03945 [Microcoleus sp.]
MTFLSFSAIVPTNMSDIEREDPFLDLGFTSEAQVLELRRVREENDIKETARKVARLSRRTIELRNDGDKDIDSDTGRPWYETAGVPVTGEQVKIDKRGIQLGRRALILAKHQSLMRQTGGDLVFASAILRAREAKHQRERLSYIHR